MSITIINNYHFYGDGWDDDDDDDNERWRPVDDPSPAAGEPAPATGTDGDGQRGHGGGPCVGPEPDPEVAAALGALCGTAAQFPYACVIATCPRRVLVAGNMCWLHWSNVPKRWREQLLTQWKILTLGDPPACLKQEIAALKAECIGFVRSLVANAAWN